MTVLFNMKITSVCCHLSIVLRFEMRILLSFLFLYILWSVFFSVNEVCVMMMSPASKMAVTMML